jgi:uncharacterized C2H2 Zn-finger protein
MSAKRTVAGRWSGMPVVVYDVWDDAEELQCPQCMKRLLCETDLIYHVGKEHYWLLKGENPIQ